MNGSGEGVRQSRFKLLLINNILPTILRFPTLPFFSTYKIPRNNYSFNADNLSSTEIVPVHVFAVRFRVTQPIGPRIATPKFRLWLP